jgi:hypothetical protein
MLGFKGWARRRFRITLTIALLGSVGTGDAKAEDPFWPEFDAFLKLSPSTRLLFTAEANDNRDEPKSKWIVGTYVDIFVPRFRPLLFRKISEVDESRSQRISVQVGYRFSHTWGTDPSQIEHRIVTDATFRWVFLDQFLGSDRNRFELRVVNGAYSWRYRNQMKISRDVSIRHTPLVPFVSGELFYDSEFQKISRYRYEAGVTFPLGKVWAVEPYWARQKSLAPSEAISNFAGLTVQAYLHR